MKKFTKRLTMIVAILLSLVLLTSSIVSTTLAKYVVAKSAEVQATLQKFGLTVTLESNTNGNKPILTKDTANSEQKGYSVTLKFDNVTLTPDDETYKEAIKASIGGKANVPAEVIITVDITCNDAAFTLSGTDFDSYQTAKVYNPIEFYVAGEGVKTAGVENNVGDGSVLATTSEEKIATAIKNKFTGTGITDGASKVEGGKRIITGKIALNAEPELSDIGLGFVWEDSNDEISTWISNQEGANFTITYTITVQQDTTKPTT